MMASVDQHLPPSLQSEDEQHWSSGLIGVQEVASGGMFRQMRHPPGVIGAQVPPLQSASVLQSPSRGAPPAPVVPAPAPVEVPAPVPVEVPVTTLPPHAARMDAVATAREKKVKK